MFIERINQKRKNTVVERLFNYKKQLTDVDSADARLTIDRTMAQIRNDSNFVNRSRYNKMVSVLTDLEKAEMGSTDFVKRHCTDILNILRNLYIEPSENEKAQTIVDGKIEEISNKIAYNDKEISKLEEKKEEALGKDKNLWKRLASEVIRLNSQNRVLNQTFEALLKKKETLCIANTVQYNKEINTLFDEPVMSVDIDEISSDIDDNLLRATDCYKESEDLQNKIFASTATNLDDAYNEALRQKAEESLETAGEEGHNPVKISV